MHDRVFVTFPHARIVAHPSVLARAYPLTPLDTRHVDDAHTAGYLVSAEKAIPRLSLASLRDARVLDNARLHYAFVDCDNPGHTPWADTSVRDRAMERIAEHPVLRDACVYSTRAGWRAVWALARPLKLDVANSWLQARLMSLSVALAIPVATERNRAHIATLDPIAARWTSLFRLPYVRRDGVDLVPWFRP